jgi:hypothetical protein
MSYVFPVLVHVALASALLSLFVPKLSIWLGSSLHAIVARDVSGDLLSDPPSYSM